MWKFFVFVYFVFVLFWFCLWICYLDVHICNCLRNETEVVVVQSNLSVLKKKKRIWFLLLCFQSNKRSDHLQCVCSESTHFTVSLNTNEMRKKKKQKLKEMIFYEKLYGNPHLPLLNIIQCIHSTNESTKM